jgi:hypothetical protein
MRYFQQVGMNTGNFASGISFAAGGSFAFSSDGIWAGDIDGDGHADVVSGSSGMFVVYGNGNGTFGSLQSLPGNKNLSR